jgi:hypothetical protein
MPGHDRLGEQGKSPAERFGRQVGQRGEIARRTGIVEHDVECAEFLDRRENQRLDLGILRDIGAAVDHLAGKSPTTTRAPSATNTSTVAKPMPLTPPVTAATLPVSLPIIQHSSAWKMN